MTEPLFRVLVLEHAVNGKLATPTFFASMPMNSLRSVFDLQSAAVGRLVYETERQGTCDVYFNDRPKFGIRTIRVEKA